MEEFIAGSNALLTVRPETTRVSITYTHKRAPVHAERVDPTAEPLKVTVKTYDPKSGLLYKHTLSRASRLSRVLASLGPQHFDSESTRKRGAASIMSEKAPSEIPTHPLEEEQIEENKKHSVDGSSAKPKKKKKAKK